MPEDATVIGNEQEPAPETTETPEQPEPRVEGDTAEPEEGNEAETETEPKQFVSIEEHNRTGYELRKLRKELSRLRSGDIDVPTIQAAQLAEFAKPEPTLDSCGGDLEKLVREHEDWKLEKRDFEQRKVTGQTQLQRALRARQEHGQQALAEAKEKYPDFEAKLDAVGMRDHNPQAAALIDALLECDNFPDVAFYLANNPNELKRISNLEGRSQDREIGKLELKIMAEQALKNNKQKPQPTKVETAGAGNKPKAERDPRKDFERARESGSDPRAWAEYIYHNKKLG